MKEDAFEITDRSPAMCHCCYSAAYGRNFCHLLEYPCLLAVHITKPRLMNAIQIPPPYINLLPGQYCFNKNPPFFGFIRIIDMQLR